MNIKGLLLGSAAALVAVSGARAADAVVDRRTGTHGIRSRLRHLRRRLLLHPRRRDLPEGLRLHRYDIGVGASGLTDVRPRHDADNVMTAGLRRRHLLQARPFRRFALTCHVGDRELGTLRAYAPDQLPVTLTTDISDDDDVRQPRAGSAAEVR